MPFWTEQVVLEDVQIVYLGFAGLASFAESYHTRQPSQCGEHILLQVDRVLKFLIQSPIGCHANIKTASDYPSVLASHPEFKLLAKPALFQILEQQQLPLANHAMINFARIIMVCELTELMLFSWHGRLPGARNVSLTSG